MKQRAFEKIYNHNPDPVKGMEEYDTPQPYFKKFKQRWSQESHHLVEFVRPEGQGIDYPDVQA